MTWDAYYHRKNVLREILQVADRDHDLTADQLLDVVPDARTAFADDIALLFDVQLAWYQRLSGQLDRMLDENDDPGVLAVEAWIAAAAAMPGARTLLDAARERPELARAFAKEHELIAVSAGVSAFQQQLASEGDRIVSEARERAVYPTLEPQEPAGHPVVSLLNRLRNALAA